MANKYCNLDGSKKIKDEFKKINVGFDEVEKDLIPHIKSKSNPHEVSKTQVGLGNVENIKQASKIEFDMGITTLNSRIDNIITTPAEGVSQQEIIDARKGHQSLGSKIDEIDDHKAEIAPNVANIVSVDYAGAVGDGVADDLPFINAAITSGGKGATILFDSSKTYGISKGIILLDGQKAEGGYCTLKKLVNFDGDTQAHNGGAPSAFTVINKNTRIKNFLIDGNKANRATPLTNNCGVLVTTDRNGKNAENTVVENVHVINCFHRGFFVLGNAKNTTIKDSTANNCNGLAGTEIWSIGDLPPQNVTFENLLGTNEYGVGSAGCHGFTVKNVHAISTAHYALFLYCGDANGGLLDATIENSSFIRTGGTGLTFEMDAEVRSGAIIGTQGVTEAKIASCTFKNTTSSIARFRGKCKPSIDNVTFEDGSTGVTVTDCDNQFIMTNSRIRKTSGSSIIASDKIQVYNSEMENFNQSETNKDGVVLNTGAENSRFADTRIGAKTGEKGRYSINGNYAVGLVGLHLENVELHNTMGDTMVIPMLTKNSSYIFNVTNEATIQRYSNGSTGNRPILTVKDVGYPYFDTTLGYQIWWSGTAWKNSVGVTV